MTSKFDYTYVPMIDSNGESVKATASKAKREDEKDLREEIKLKEATSLYSTESKTEERVEESSDDETENEKLVNYLLKSDSDETDEAFKLIEFNSSPININEIKEISAALLDEVDRVNDFQNDEQIIFNENVNLDKMKFQWGKDREKRLFNLEGVIEVLRNRVDELERRILTKREDANAMEGFEYSHNSEGSDNSSQDDGEYGQGCESCNIESGKSLKDRLDDVEQQFDGIANRVDQVEKLGEK